MVDWLWIVFTVAAAAAQTARNAAQRGLTDVLGTIGATNVRFLYGLPFAILFFVAMLTATGVSLPVPSLLFWGWVVMGAVTQILATGLMLAAMRERAFVVAIAYTKTEPIWVALFAIIVLHEQLSALTMSAILIATLGVMLMSWPKKSADGLWNPRPILFGATSGALFALAAVGYRGAILEIHLPFLPAATTTLMIGLAVQAAVITAYLGLFARAVLIEVARAWRSSLVAGFMGAFASQLWFLAFALERVARVRTLALVEMLFAWAVTRNVLRETLSRREAGGVVLLILGVILVLNG